MVTATMKKPALKNTYSEASIESILAKIQKTLVEHGVEEFTYETDKQDRSQFTALRFAFTIEGRLLHFRMPANVAKVRKVLIDRARNQREVTAAQKNAYRIAWATIRDWLSIQMALIDINQAELPQIFLPYALNEEGQTFYESLKERQFKLLPEGEVTEGEYHLE